MVARLAEQYRSKLKPETKFFGLYGKVLIGERNVHLLVPTTFMNNSGKAVAALVQFYKIPVEAILVAHDELDIAPGTARLKIGGGHGGHNGLRDIIKAVANNPDFARLRIGIGHPGHAKLVSGYVLRKAPHSEQEQIDASITDALRYLPLAVDGQWNDAMKALHTPAM